MCAKNHLLIFSSFLDIWENVEWPRFFGPPGSLASFVVVLRFSGRFSVKKTGHKITAQVKRRPTVTILPLTSVSINYRYSKTENSQSLTHKITNARYVCSIEIGQLFTTLCYFCTPKLQQFQ